MKHILSFCLIAFILAGNVLINTDHISRITIYRDIYRIHFDNYYPGGDYIDIPKNVAPNLIDQLRTMNYEL